MHHLDDIAKDGEVDAHAVGKAGAFCPTRTKRRLPFPAREARDRGSYQVHERRERHGVAVIQCPFVVALAHNRSHVVRPRATLLRLRHATSVGYALPTLSPTLVEPATVPSPNDVGQ